MGHPVAETQPAGYQVMAEAEPAVRLFCGLATQWRIGAMGGVLGLDYAAAESAARGLLMHWPAVFEHLQTLEHAALPVLNKPKK